ncbi:MAG: NAD(P)H-dependent glycerol-3-phosphate dehydrogenase [Cytophagales bacterium]|nr:NAD(P)H-dependent glycerol-3-phosphate dehydrogenase [Cytophagales bacterium]
MKEQKKNPRVAVVGDGSWATAIVSILMQNDLQINWWVRKEENARYIQTNGRNKNYLTGVKLNPSLLSISSSLEEVIRDVDYVFLVVPSAFIKDVLLPLSQNCFEGKVIVSAIKGMIPKDNVLVTDFINDYFGVPHKDMTVIGGPCHAEEVGLGRQSYLTIGGEDLVVADNVANLLRCNYVNVHVLKDLVGIEYSAIMKNIVALACGITHGLNYGDNFQAVLVSNAMQEIRYLLDELFPAERDVNSSAYLGDLLVTAYSQFSRNRTFGKMIGRGYSVKSTIFEMQMIAEGYYAVECIADVIEKNQLEMPITSTVYRILYEKKSPAMEIGILKEILK